MSLVCAHWWDRPEHLLSGPSGGELGEQLDWGRAGWRWGPVLQPYWEVTRRGARGQVALEMEGPEPCDWWVKGRREQGQPANWSARIFQEELLGARKEGSFLPLCLMSGPVLSVFWMGLSFPLKPQPPVIGSSSLLVPLFPDFLQPRAPRPLWTPTLTHLPAPAGFQALQKLLLSSPSHFPLSPPPPPPATKKTNNFHFF